MKKKMLGILLSVAMVMSVFSGCGSDKAESEETTEETTEETKEVEEEEEDTEKEEQETEEDTEKEDSEGEKEVKSGANELVGQWYGIESNKGNEMEFFDDGSFTVKEGEHSGEGTYQLAETKDSMEFTLKNDATGEEMTGTIYVKFYGDHIAIHEYEEDLELTGGNTVDYYVRSEAKGKYDSEDGFSGKNTVWVPQSGIETIEIGGESYSADEIYVRFIFNVIQLGIPEEMGDTTFKILGHAPYEFKNGCSTIEFFANDPFSDATDTSYDVEVSDDTLTFSGNDMEIKCKEVEVK